MPAAGTWSRRARYVAGLVCLAALAWVVTLAGWAGVGRFALGWDLRVITSGSMSPLLEPGDLVLVDPTAPSPDVGAVVLFDGPSGPMLHRVVEATDDGLRTRGDAVEIVDPAVLDPADVDGVARVLLPAAGWLQVNLPAPAAAGIAAASLLLLLAGVRWAFDPGLDPWVRPVAARDPFRPEPVAAPGPAAPMSAPRVAAARRRRSSTSAPGRPHRQVRRQARRQVRPVATTSPTGGTVLFVAKGTFA